jgi:hypothetical protein
MPDRQAAIGPSDQFVEINWWSGRQVTKLSDILKTPDAQRVLGNQETKAPPAPPGDSKKIEEK